MIWLTSPPISVNVTGGVYVQGMDERGFRFNVMEGNLMVATTTASHGYDVIDLHYHMLHQIHKRMPDGIHWTQQAVRFQLNIILTHYCLSRKIPLPGRDKSKLVKAAIKVAEAANEGPVEFVEKKKDESDTNNKNKKRIRHDEGDDDRDDRKRKRPIAK